MNYLRELIEFEKKSNAIGLTSSARSLYYGLLNINNNFGWTSWFSVANSVIQRNSGINHRSTFERARQSLINNEFIKYEKGKANKAPKYSIIQQSGVRDILRDIPRDVLRDIPQDIVRGILNKYKYKYKYVYVYRGEKKIRAPEKEVEEYTERINDVLTTDELKNLFIDFIENLEAKNKQITDKALIYHLDTLKDIKSEEKRLSSLRKAVINKWLGIYPTKSNDKVLNSHDLTPENLKGEYEEVEELFE